MVGQGVYRRVIGISTRLKAIGGNFLALSLLSLLTVPAYAQWGGGDGAQAGATAYCAARAAGRDDNQASRAAANALSNSMTGSFSSNIATIITGGSAMRDSLKYLISKQCPEYVNTPGDSSASQSKATLDQWTPELCAKYPDVGKNYCAQNVASPSAIGCPEGGASNGCQVSVPEQKAASDAAPAPGSSKKSVDNKKNSEKVAHGICLKAADYAGCMKYQLAK